MRQRQSADVRWYGVESSQVIIVTTVEHFAKQLLITSSPGVQTLLVGVAGRKVHASASLATHKFI